MSVNDTSRNGSMPTTIEESTEPVPSHEPTQARESTVLNGRHEPATAFATRADTKGVEGISKNKLILLGGGLAVAVLFFVFTALVGKSPKKPTQVRQPSQQANQELMKPPKGSVTPVMDTVRTPAPDNSNGQPNQHAGSCFLHTLIGFSEFAGQVCKFDCSNFENRSVQNYRLGRCIDRSIAEGAGMLRGNE